MRGLSKLGQGSYDFAHVNVYGSWEVGHCCGFAGAERLLSHPLPLGTPGLLALTNSLKNLSVAASPSCQK